MILVCKGCGAEFESERSAREYCTRTCSNRAANAKRTSEFAEKPRTTVWSCGGGVDSTAIAALVVDGVLPKPDIAVIVDVGWEKQTTWDYLDTVTRPRLKAVGIDIERIRTADFKSNWFFDDLGSCVIPAYRKTSDGIIIKLNTRCSGPWKLHVVKRWLRSQGVESCENWVGIAADESHRARQSPDKWFRIRYPLIELGMAREDCQYYLGEVGWPRAHRSSCVICPQMADREWAEIKFAQPEEFARAVAIEEQIHRVDPSIFLHRSCVPLSAVEFDERSGLRFPCVCFSRETLTPTTA